MRTGIVSTLVISFLAGNTLAATDDIVGRWDLQVEPGGYPSWIAVKKERQHYNVEFLWMGGGVETPPEKARVEGNKVTFRARDMNWEGVAAGDKMTGTATEKTGKVNNTIIRTASRPCARFRPWRPNSTAPRGMAGSR